MEVWFILAPFVLLGLGALLIAFSGGPAAAREAYLGRGGRLFAFVIVVSYLVLGVAVPAAVIAERGEAEGAVGSLRTEDISASDKRGKELFVQSCKSCHNLDAVNARGVTGPDLDELGGVTKERVLNAIKNGGTGQNLMPALILRGEDAEDVAGYVSKVAGQ
ncbi:MAG TPA: cytochrome c [Thermoleophilaceae bacterium]|jgi:cytochrome c553|nr:cytochrome c [Thermoleophilaceae bacterium]